MKSCILSALLLWSFHFQVHGQVLSPISPDKGFEIKLGAEDIGDVSVKFTSYVVDKQESDTLFLGVNTRHDFPPPNWFWDTASKYLIFETSEYGGNSHISIWDLAQKKVSHRIKGAIPIPRTIAGQFWDSKEEVLFFYDLGDSKQPQKPQLKSLSLITKQVKLLHEFSNYFEIELPLIEIDHTKRTINTEGKTIQY